MAKNGRHIAPPQKFTAQQKGYYYSVRQTLPISTANCTLVNPALNSKDKNYRLYMWINDFTTGYKLLGDWGQGPSTRAFYPHQVGQDNLKVKGQWPSNYAYDRMVEFLTVHHQMALDAPSRNMADANGTSALKLFMREDIVKAVNGESYRGNSKKIYNVFVPNVPAGAERFQNARSYELEMIVVNNYLETKVETMAFDRLLRRYVNSLTPEFVHPEFLKSDLDIYDFDPLKNFEIFPQ